jgi:hypothetical protein
MPIIERGAFYEPSALSDQELPSLRRSLRAEEEKDALPAYQLVTRHEFVEEVLFAKDHRAGAQIVGFNLLFDIPRVAVRHVDARKDMKGGFSFVLIDKSHKGCRKAAAMWGPSCEKHSGRT